MSYARDGDAPRRRTNRVGMVVAVAISLGLAGALVWWCRCAHEQAGERLLAQVDTAIEQRGYEQAEALLKHLGSTFGDTAAAAGIPERRRLCERNAQARRPHSRALKLHQAGRFAEAATAYAAVQRDFPQTAFAEGAAAKVQQCRDQSKRYAAARQALAGGQTGRAVQLLDGLESEGVQPDPALAARARERLARERVTAQAAQALALEKRLDWKGALERWRAAQKILETEQAGRHIAVCRRHLGHPVELTDVAGTVWNRRRSISFRARVANYRPRSVRNVRARVRVYDQEGMESDRPLSDKTYRVSGSKVIGPGDSTTVSFTVAVPEAQRAIAGYDYGVVGYDEAQ